MKEVVSIYKAKISVAPGVAQVSEIFVIANDKEEALRIATEIVKHRYGFGFVLGISCEPYKIVDLSTVKTVKF